MNKYEKLEALKKYLLDQKKVCVAFSAGVDSTFLLSVAFDTLGECATAVTARSHSFPSRELDASISFCKEREIKQIIIDSDELSVEGFSSNPSNRCYLCKKALFSKMLDLAAKEGLGKVVEGSNVDDEGDYRPGLQAIKELSIDSPLRKVGLSKSEIRQLSKEMGLPTFNKPSFACLASRFVYGETITIDKLKMVEQAEQFLIDLGIEQVRVRIHGLSGRIEIPPEQFSIVFERAGEINEELKALGFTYVSLDLGGYKTGNMNKSLGC